MIVGTSMIVVVINIIICTFFELTVSFEKRHTVSEETQGMFNKISILQFINIALIVLIVNFDFIDDRDNTEKFLGFLPIFNGDL